MVYFLRNLENPTPNLFYTRLRCADKSNYPPQSPLERGEAGNSSPLPFTRGGLGWGKNQLLKLLQTCVYTVGGTLKAPFLSGLGDLLCVIPHNVRG